MLVMIELKRNPMKKYEWQFKKCNPLSSTGKTAIPLHWNQCVGAIDSKAKF